jgi:hypothetical protein
MDSESTQLTPNTLAFIALCNEYCNAVELARESERQEFIDSMLRLLPRIYISAADLKSDLLDPNETYIDSALEEDYYDSMRRNVALLLGEDDAYLDVFEDDMKYSDTPIAASISEGVADLFQVMFNFLETVRNAPYDLVNEAVQTMHEDFEHYWSMKLCDVLRAINALKYR